VNLGTIRCDARGRLVERLGRRVDELQLVENPELLEQRMGPRRVVAQHPH
jgi:hypothetical protein